MSDRTSYLFFGRKVVIEALRSGKRMDKILIAKGGDESFLLEIKDMLPSSTALQFVPRQKLDSITRKNHQGIIAYAALVDYYKIDDVLAQLYEDGENPLFLALDGVTDVGNFGAICRSAYSLGVHAIIVPSKGSAQINPIAVKSSAGAIHHIKMCKVDSLKKSLSALQKQGISLVSTTLTDAEVLEKVDLSIPACIILGNEEKGVGSQINAMANQRALIPMTRDFDSLNVSVAAGIVLYECQKQRANS